MNMTSPSRVPRPLRESANDQVRAALVAGSDESPVNDWDLKH